MKAMTGAQIEEEITKINPGAVTCTSKTGDSVAILKNGQWVTVAAKTIMGTWANVPFPGLCANGKEVFPQSLYMDVK